MKTLRYKTLLVGCLALVSLAAGCQSKHNPTPVPAVQPELAPRVKFEAVAFKAGTSAPGYLVVSRKPIRLTKLEDVLITVRFNHNDQTPVRWECAGELLKDSLYVGLHYSNTFLLDSDGKPKPGDAVEATLKVNGRPFTSLRIDASTYQNPANRWLYYDGKENSGIEMGGRW